MPRRRRSSPASSRSRDASAVEGKNLIANRCPAGWLTRGEVGRCSRSRGRAAATHTVFGLWQRQCRLIRAADLASTSSGAAQAAAVAAADAFGGDGSPRGATTTYGPFTNALTRSSTPPSPAPRFSSRKHRRRRPRGTRCSMRVHVEQDVDAAVEYALRRAHRRRLPAFPEVGTGRRPRRCRAASGRRAALILAGAVRWACGTRWHWRSHRRRRGHHRPRQGFPRRRACDLGSAVDSQPRRRLEMRWRTLPVVGPAQPLHLMHSFRADAHVINSTPRPDLPADTVIRTGGRSSATRTTHTPGEVCATGDWTRAACSPGSTRCFRRRGSSSPTAGTSSRLRNLTSGPDRLVLVGTGFESIGLVCSAVGVVEAAGGG